jgi:uncharacterized protein
MQWLVDQPGGSEKVSEFIAYAGGKIVGRTRLQKMFYLLKEAGYQIPFSFEYRHYGPFSEQLATAASLGRFEGLIREEEHPASWGGTYSIFSTEPATPSDPNLVNFLSTMNDANPIDLELVATAVFLSKEEKHREPWQETIRRKPEKAHRVQAAKELLSRLSQLNLVTRLPDLR